LSLIILFACVSFGQPSPDGFPEAPGAGTQSLPLKKDRILGLIPNNRTSPNLKDYKPLSPREKFEIARQDPFDRGTVVLTAVFAADAQLGNPNPSFGQGAKGYTRYFGASYGDFIIGNYVRGDLRDGPSSGIT
jgi:hypothetical protein